MTATVHELRRTKDDLADLTVERIAQYAGVLPARWVIRCVARNVQWLREQGVPDDRLARSVGPIVDADLADRAEGRVT